MRGGWGAIDAIDFRLLDALRRDPTAPHVALARAIGRSPSAVRRRLHRLREDGVLMGFVAAPAPSVLGLEGVAATWNAPAPAGGLLALPGTIMAGNSIGGGTLAGGYAPDARAWLEAASAVVGEPPATEMGLDEYRGPVLGPLDLRILRALVQAPRGSAERLADLCGLSPKTVRKHRARLLADKAVKIHPMVRTGATDDLVYHLHVTCTPQQVRPVIKSLGDASVAPGADPILCAFVRAETLSEQARTLAAVRALGVERVEVVHEDEWVFDDAAVLGMIDAALAAWSAAVAPRGDHGA